MTIRKLLQNPLLLTAEGFVAGALLFWATMPQPADAASASAPPAAEAPAR